METADELAPAALRSVAPSAAELTARKAGYRRARLVIATRRRELSIQQKDLAEHLGISPATLCEIEKGKGRASPAVQLKLVDRLNLDVEGAFDPIPEPERDVLTKLDALRFARAHFPHSKVKHKLTISGAIERGELPAERDDRGRYRIQQKDLVAWLRGREGERTATCSGCGETFARRPSKLERSKSGIHYCPNCRWGWCDDPAWRSRCVEALRSYVHPSWTRASKNRWRGRLVLSDARPEKGKAAALETAELAVAFLSERAAQPTTRRRVVEHLLEELEGRHALYAGSLRRSTKDPVYRAARKRIERRLDRGSKLLGSDELAQLQ